jgi:hypothetical protein
MIKICNTVMLTAIEYAELKKQASRRASGPAEGPSTPQPVEARHTSAEVQQFINEADEYIQTSHAVGVIRLLVEAIRIIENLRAVRPDMAASSLLLPEEAPSESAAPYVPTTVDGLKCVEWVKKYRNEKRCTLSEAKDEWDRRVTVYPMKYGPIGFQCTGCREIVDTIFPYGLCLKCCSESESHGDDRT